MLFGIIVARSGKKFVFLPVFKSLKQIQMKKTKYLNGLITLSVGSLLASGCSQQQQKTSDADWMNKDTIPGKVVEDKQGNEWVWHSGTGGGFGNMLMGYWLINSLTNGVQTRYYPSNRSYTMDNNANTPVSRPGNIATNPVKTKEGIIPDGPTVNRPMNRSALRIGKAINPQMMKPAVQSARSTRSGFGRTGTRSFGS